MKVYSGYTAVPWQWISDVNVPGESTVDEYAHVCIVAPTKADAVQNLCRQGYDVRVARRIVDKTRLNTTYLTTDSDIGALVEAGVIRLDRPRVYAWRDSADGAAVNLVLYGKRSVTIGRFVRPDGGDRTARKLIQGLPRVDGGKNVEYDGRYVGTIRPEAGPVAGTPGWTMIARSGRVHWAPTEDLATDQLVTGDYSLGKR